MCWLRVTGDDAASFLQGQFTNDLRLLEKSAAVYGLWLTVKGKVLADSFVLRGGDPHEFWIGSYYSPSATIRDPLTGHTSLYYERNVGPRTESGWDPFGSMRGTLIPRDYSASDVAGLRCTMCSTRRALRTSVK